MEGVSENTLSILKIADIVIVAWQIDNREPAARDRQPLTGPGLPRGVVTIRIRAPGARRLATGRRGRSGCFVGCSARWRSRSRGGWWIWGARCRAD